MSQAVQRSENYSVPRRRSGPEELGGPLASHAAVHALAQAPYLELTSPIGTSTVIDDSSSVTAQLKALEAAVPNLSIEYALKRLLDVVGALVLAAVFSPLIVGISIWMRRNGGHVLYKHERVGLNGEAFQCLKFCTMVSNADQALRRLLDDNPVLRAEWLRDHKLRDDPRVTSVGKFLRRTSLDELPQIWNVLKGEMSLVGPRPVTREELLRYGRNSVIYMMARPGITGLWQVSGRSNTDYRRRVAMDVCYIRNQSAFFDLWILARTTLVVLGRRGAY